MFKKTMLLFSAIFFITLAIGCSTEDTINVMVPNGAPSLSQSHIEYHNDGRYNIEVVDGADPLAAAFTSESHHIIFAPTNLGARLISLGASYRFAAAVSFGNLYIATANDSITGFSDLEGEEIVLFGQNTTGDALVNVLIEAYDFEVEPTISYVGSVQEAMGFLLQNNNAIVLLAEPVLSMAKNQIGELNVIDIQAEWTLLTGEESYPQAGVFVHRDLSDKAVDEYLVALEESITTINSDHDRLIYYNDTLEYPFNSAVIRQAIEGMNIRYVSAEDIRHSLEFYFLELLGFNPALINHALPSETFYYSSSIE